MLPVLCLLVDCSAAILLVCGCLYHPGFEFVPFFLKSVFELLLEY